MDGELNYRNTINSWRRDGGSIAGASSWGYCIRSSGEDGICGYRDLISPSIRFHQGVSPQSRALSGLLSSLRAISENEQCTISHKDFYRMVSQVLKNAKYTPKNTIFEPDPKRKVSLSLPMPCLCDDW